MSNKGFIFSLTFNLAKIVINNPSSNANLKFLWNRAAITDLDEDIEECFKLKIINVRTPKLNLIGIFQFKRHYCQRKRALR